MTKKLDLILIESWFVNRGVADHMLEMQDVTEELQVQGFDISPEHLLVHSVSRIGGEYLYLNTLKHEGEDVRDCQHPYGRAWAEQKLKDSIRSYLGKGHDRSFMNDPPHLLVSYHQAERRIRRVAEALGVEVQRMVKGFQQKVCPSSSVITVTREGGNIRLDEPIPLSYWAEQAGIEMGYARKKRPF